MVSTTVNSVFSNDSEHESAFTKGSINLVDDTRVICRDIPDLTCGATAPLEIPLEITPNVPIASVQPIGDLRPGESGPLAETTLSRGMIEPVAVLT
jgi:hypothetical protein